MHDKFYCFLILYAFPMVFPVKTPEILPARDVVCVRVSEFVEILCWGLPWACPHAGKSWCQLSIVQKDTNFRNVLD